MEQQRFCAIFTKHGRVVAVDDEFSVKFSFQPNTENIGLVDILSGCAKKTADRS
jgi:hypothetical protein